MKKGQKYVVRCHKRHPSIDWTSGDLGYYEVGDLVSPKCSPVKDIDQAYVYEVDEEDFPWEDDFEYFEPVPVRIVVIES